MYLTDNNQAEEVTNSSLYRNIPAASRACKLDFDNLGLHDLALTYLVDVLGLRQRTSDLSAPLTLGDSADSRIFSSPIPCKFSENMWPKELLSG